MQGGVLRLLAEKKKDYWLATCLELNLMAIGNTSEEALAGLKDAILGYLEAVFDTDDKLSVPKLLDRPAPISKRLLFLYTYHRHRLKKWKAETFNPRNHSHANSFAAHA